MMIARFSCEILGPSEGRITLKKKQKFPGYGGISSSPRTEASGQDPGGKKNSAAALPTTERAGAKSTQMCTVG